MRKILTFAAIAGIMIGLIAMTLVLFEGYVSEEAKWHFIVSGVLIAVYAVSRASELITGIRSRKAKLGAVVSFYSAVVFAIVFAVNVIGAVTNVQIADLTESGLYTLSPITKKVVAAIKSDMKIYAFYSGGVNGLNSVRDVSRLLTTIESSSKHISLEIVDPEIEVLKAEKYAVYEDGTLVIEYEGKTQKINTITDETITNTLLKLLDDRPKKVCLSAGHGEFAISGDASFQLDGLGRFVETLKSKNYETDSIILAGQEEIPADCTVVAIVGGSSPLSTAELVIVDNYLHLGGRVFINEGAGSEMHLEPLLERWGANLDNNLVLDKVVEGRFTDGSFAPTQMRIAIDLTITDYNRNHPITQDLSVKHPVNLLKSRSISRNSAVERVNYYEILRSKTDSWGETEVANTLTGGRAIFNPRDNDMPGPLVLGVALSYNTQSATEQLEGYSKQARMVVVGSSAWLTNSVMDETKNYNADLAVNIVGWLAGMEEFIALGSQTVSAKSLFLRPDQKNIIFTSTIILIPELILLCGLFVWWIRR